MVCVRFHRRLLWLLGALWLVTGAAAVRGAETAPGPGHGLLITFSGVPAEVALASLEKGGILTPGQVATARVRSSADPELLDLLRGRLLGWNPGVTGSPAGATCQPPADSFPRLLLQAGDSIDYLERERASDALSDAVSALSCRPELVKRKDLARYLFFSGVLHLYLGNGNDGGYFADALSLVPDIPTPDEYRDEVLHSFQAARSQPPRPPVSVRYETGALAGLELWIDGEKVAGGAAHLPEGRHFLQVVSPSGRSLAGATFTLKQDSANGSLTLPPSNLRPPDQRKVMGQLLLQTMNGQLDAQIETALEQLARDQEDSWIVLLAPTPGVDEVQAILFQSGSTIPWRSATVKLVPAASRRTGDGQGSAPTPGTGSRSTSGLAVEPSPLSDSSSTTDTRPGPPSSAPPAGSVPGREDIQKSQTQPGMPGGSEPQSPTQKALAGPPSSTNKPPASSATGVVPPPGKALVSVGLASQAGLAYFRQDYNASRRLLPVIDLPLPQGSYEFEITCRTPAKIWKVALKLEAGARLSIVLDCMTGAVTNLEGALHEEPASARGNTPSEPALAPAASAQAVRGSRPAGDSDAAIISLQLKPDTRGTLLLSRGGTKLLPIEDLALPPGDVELEVSCADSARQWKIPHRLAPKTRYDMLLDCTNGDLKVVESSLNAPLSGDKHP